MKTSYWDLNVNALRSRNPEIIITPGIAGKDKGRLEVKLARNGLPIVAVNFEGRFIHLHSAYDPRMEALNWLKSFNGENGQAVVILGFGQGYHVEELLSKYPEINVIVIEPDTEIFFKSLELRDLRPFLRKSNWKLILGSDAKTVAKQILPLITSNMAAPTFLAWPPYFQLWRDFWQDLQVELAGLMRQQVTNIATNRAFSSQWLVNFFANLAVSISDPGVKLLFTPFVNRPAIIVAAGPSLDKNIHLLNNAQGRALIVAAGSAINPMLKNNLKPDLLVSFDPGEANYKHFANLRLTDVPLAYSPTIYPRIIEEYAGPRFVMGMDVFPFTTWTFTNLGEDKGTVASGPSVANVAWDLARRMGCNPIIFVGQDLAYPNQKSHAEGVVTAHKIEINDINQQTYFYTEDVFGNHVLTDRAMYAMKVWFEQRIASVGHERVFIDASEGGARIEGTVIMPLVEVLEKYCQQCFAPHKQILAIYGSERKRLQALPFRQSLSKFLQDLEEQLSQIEEVYREALKVAKPAAIQSATRRLNAQRYQEVAVKLQKLEQRLGRMVIYQIFIQPFLHHVITTINYKLTKELEQETNIDRRGNKLIKIYLSLFKASRDKGAEIKKLIKAS